MSPNLSLIYTNQKLLRKIDYVSVRCVFGNETNIKRDSFKDHITRRYSIRIGADYKENIDSLEEHSNLEH